MYKIFIFYLYIILFFISCIKENSCEGCIQTNKSPVARAGSDTIITLPVNSLMLDGSNSYDPDGQITSYK